MKPEQLAMNSVTTRHQDLEDALKAYAAAGFKNVELHLLLAKVEGREETNRQLASRDLTCCGGFETTITCFAGAEEKERSLQALLENAEFLSAIGGRTLAFGTDGPREPSSDSLQIVGQAMAEAADLVEPLGIDLALEFNWSPLVRSLESAVAAVRSADRPNLGIVFDFAHYQTTVTKSEQLTPANVAYIKQVHLNDMRAKPADLADPNSDRVLPGDGILDLPRLIGALEQAGYAGFFSVELFNDELWHTPAAEAAEKCYLAAVQFCS